MKAFIAACVLFCLLTSGAFITSTALTRQSDKLVAQVADLQAATPDERERYTERWLVEWERSRFAFSLTINHTELDALENQFAHIEGAVGSKNGDEFLIAASELSSTLSHIRDLCRLSIDNIL